MTRALAFAPFALALILFVPSQMSAFPLLPSMRPSPIRSYSKIIGQRGSVRLFDSTSTEQETAVESTVEGITPLNEETPCNETHARTDSSFWESLRATVGGSVDESRILYPEINDGEVSRMFSSLEYCAESGKAQHATGSVMGASALVAGTTVGAGVLALPAATASVGFIPSTAALLVAYVFMTMAGLLIAELTLNQIGRTGRPGLGLLELYKTSLGAGWSTVGTAAYFFLHYAMMVAYIAQGGTNLQGFMGPNLLPGSTPQIAFASAIGASLLVTKPAWIEQVNNAMVLAVGASFLCIVGIGAQTADWSSLTDAANQHSEGIISCFPILFLALVYQNVVPTVVNNLEGDRTKITQSIIAGTTAPLLMFLAWNAVCLGNVSGSDTGGMDPVALLQSGAAGGDFLLAPLVTSFSVLALITSLIGFTFGLVDAWTDILGINQKSEAFSRYKPALYGLVYLPPLALSTTDPSVFYTALEYGGAFGVSTLFLVLPPLMVWKERYQETDSPLITKPMVAFGKIPLGAMWLAAGTLIFQQAVEKSGILEMAESAM